MKEERKEEQTSKPIVGAMAYRISMSEVDAYGVMHYSRIFDVFERGRAELMRAIGFEHKKLFQQRQIIMPVVETACRYMAPMVYDDVVTVETAITSITPKGIRFDYRVMKDDVTLAVGFTQHIFIDPQGRPVNFGVEIFEELKKKGLIEETAKQEPGGEEEDVSEKLKKLVTERVKEDKPN
jgi:acyl-CoA thioester hydrolase